MGYTQHLRSLMQPSQRVGRRLGVLQSALAGVSADAPEPEPIAWSLRGPFRLRLMLTAQRQHVEVEITPPEPLTSTDELYEDLAEWNAAAAGWTKGDRLLALRADETTTPGLLHADDDSLSVRVSGDGLAASSPLVRGVDYEVDEQWGTIGWLPGGALADRVDSQPRAVLVTYTWTPLRLDSLVLRVDGSIELRMGKPYGVAPPLPELASGERRLMNIWLPGRVAEAGLSAASLFPVLETAPSMPPSLPLSAGGIPRTLEKLR